MTTFLIPTLNTRRLILRPYRLEDVDALHDILQQADIMQYFPNPAAPNRERVVRIVEHFLAHWQEHHYGWWAVTLPPDDRPLGWCGLTYLPETGETEVAYLLSKTYWGQGYIPEAARASLRYGFEQCGLSRIIALVHPENVRSQRVALKIGMRFVDQSRYFDMDCYRYECFSAPTENEGG